MSVQFQKLASDEDEMVANFQRDEAQEVRNPIPEERAACLDAPRPAEQARVDSSNHTKCKSNKCPKITGIVFLLVVVVGIVVIVIVKTRTPEMDVPHSYLENNSTDSG